VIDVRTTTRRVYLASSWRNQFHTDVHDLVCSAGHDVYNFREPADGETGFAWAEMDPDWQKWTPDIFVNQLCRSPVAKRGYSFDKAALDWCDTCVCLLPCGRSAHLEAGYAIGRGKYTIFYLKTEQFEPELMYLLGDNWVTSDAQLLTALRRL
jgi:hypothetical protein